MEKRRSGISLIVLVITIVVLSILAGTVIISLSNTNIISQASDAVNKAQRKQIEEVKELMLADGLLGNNPPDQTIGDVTLKWDEATKTVIEVDSKTSEYDNLPIFVGSTAECTNTSKKYVLPDGYLYEYEPVYETSYTNQIPISTDSTTTGFANDTRINSSGNVVSNVGTFTTGFIPIEPGDIIRVNGQYLKLNSTTVNTASLQIALYNSSKSRITSTAMSTFNGYNFINVEQDSDGYFKKFQLREASTQIANWSDIVYVRFTMIGEGKDAVLTVNEEITEPVQTGSAWKKTKQYVPEDWVNEITTTANAVNNLKSGSTDTVQFILTSDIHYPDGAGMVQNIGKVSAEVMKRCSIPYFVNLGDSTTQSSNYSISDLSAQIDDVVNKVLSPINSKMILATVGNHDGATGQKVVDGTTLHYRYQLNNAARAQTYFGWQKSNTAKVFSEDGTYYYLDNADTKTRYIVLNSFWSEWAGDEDGFTTDIEHSFFHNPIFGQTQLSWFANVALNMPQDYAAVIITHDASSAEDVEIFKGILTAYKNKSTYNGTYTGNQTWQSSSVAVNYTNAVGDVIAIFHGHNHKDIINTTTYAVPYIGITTAGAYEDVRDTNAPTRTAGTATETAIDVVTIDKTNKTIYLTRLGAGTDRSVSY